MKKYLFLFFPIYFATRAIDLGIEGNFGFGFILRVILFFLSLYWAIHELKFSMFRLKPILHPIYSTEKNLSHLTLISLKNYLCYPVDKPVRTQTTNY